MTTKHLIGMIHLKALPTSPKCSMSLEEIFHEAKQDLEALQQSKCTAAIVENFFDTPYTNELSLETIVAYTHLFTRLKAISTIPLGVNLQATDQDEEMIVATMCQADFVRVESFVEDRYTTFGTMKANGHKIMRTKQRLGSNVKVYCDIHVKHSYPVSSIPLEVAIKEAIAAKADAIILTGLETGSAPTLQDAQRVKMLCQSVPLIIGSGVQHDNIHGFLRETDGVIVGSSLKRDGIIDNPVDLERTHTLFNH